MNDRIKRIAGTAGLYLPLAALLIGLLILSISVPSMVQSSAPVPMQHTFTGEYSWDRENWYTLDDSADLDALNGDLYLRGSLGAKIWEGGQLYFFSNHISGEIYVNGELCYADILMEMERYGIGIQPAMCGRGWGVWYFRDGLPENAEVEIHLKNPHSFGNKSAYRDFLSTLYSMNDGPELLQASMAGHTRPQTGIGIVLALVAAMLLGASAAGAVMRFPVSGRIARLGLMAAFAGGYFVLDTIGLSFWSENNLLNTYGRQICMMYAVYFLGLVCRDELKGRAMRLAGAALAVSAVIDAVIVLLSFAGAVLIYDTLVFWVISQILLCPLLIGCCLGSLSGEPVKKKVTVLFFCALFFAVLLDIAGLLHSRYSAGTVTKLVFIAFFCWMFITSAENIILDHKASARAKKLEKELEESRIAVMLSQIRPHFMYNVLGTLRGLCREDPEQAWRGLGDFATYLRGNMNALSNSKSITFDSELRHVETYLRLEKMRLGDKLNVVYDIQEKNFDIPPLTLQPLVENAVKHGIFYKQSGGTIVIRSGREGGKILISVQDDGVGFAAKKPENVLEPHSHVGMENVRSRVEIMLGGRLTVESELDCGTTVTIEIPVQEKETEGA